MRLFKYVGATGARILETRKLRFTPANEFNDPFECRPDSKLVEHPAWQKQNEDDVVAELMAEEHIRAAIERRPLRRTEAELRGVHRRRYRERIPEIKLVAREELARARAPFRILCLSQVGPTDQFSLLMWGHYTGNHQGFVIEFNPSHEWLRSHEPVHGEPHDCGPVEYSKDRVGWDVHPDGNVDPRRAFIFTKGKEWTYEREYRLIRFANTPGVDATTVDALVSFPPEAVVSITLGVQMNRETETALLNCCRSPAFRHVRLRREQVHPDEYQLTLDDV